MSRLLHAAARGARIQLYQGKKYGWKDTELFGPWSHDDCDRIHPADEHLAYGPISTALRDMAKEPKTIYHKKEFNLLPHFGFTIFAENENELLEVLRCDKLTHSIFLLILAEALANSGL